MKMDYVEYTGAEVKKGSLRDVPPSLNVRLDIVDATMKNDTMDVTFIYTAEYSPETHIRLFGMSGFSGDDVKKAHESWKKSKKFPDDIRSQVLTALNHASSINSVFIARIFNLMPPIVPAVIGRDMMAERPSKK